MLPDFQIVRPTSLTEAAEELRGTGAAIVAGGTELLGCMRDDISHAKRLVSTSRLHQLRGISWLKSGELRIGALTTLSELEANSEVQQHYAALAQGAAAAASPQLRNQGTIGGNLCQKPRCWYYRSGFHCLRKGGTECFAAEGENAYHAIMGGHQCFVVHPSDTAPALHALDARARIYSAKGQRLVPLSEFFLLPEKSLIRETVLDPTEIIVDILLPPPHPDLRCSYRKVRARGSWDFALAGVALALTLHSERIEAARVVLSGIAPIPWRSIPAESVLSGQRLTPYLAERAGRAAAEGATPLSQNEYKVHLIRGVVEESLLSFC